MNPSHPFVNRSQPPIFFEPPVFFFIIQKLPDPMNTNTMLSYALLYVPVLFVIFFIPAFRMLYRHSPPADDEPEDDEDDDEYQEYYVDFL